MSTRHNPLKSSCSAGLRRVECGFCEQPPSGGTLEEQLERWGRDPDGQEQQTYRDFLVALREADEMNAVCGVLKRAGAQYYSSPAECPEGRAMGL